MQVKKNKMKIILNPQKKKILKQLEKQYGITKLPYLLLQFGKEKIRIYSGNLSTEELRALNRNIRIENIGLYFAIEHREELRLTLDTLSLFKNQITKNIINLTDKQAEQWLKGYDLEIKSDSTFKILKHNNEFIGCGKSTGEKITNFIPKERRIK